MQYDRKITISAGSNRRAMTWQAQTMLISELWARLQAPASQRHGNPGGISEYEKGPAG